jgi:serine/threonine-protein kinase
MLLDANDHADALPIGTTIDDRYMITGVIASGGMGIVHRARHGRLGIDVAVKTVRRALASDSEVIERFAEEARNAARLHGQQFVRIFDRGRLSDGRPYLVMELLEGEDLADRISREGYFSNEFVIELLRQACDALSEAHGIGIVHRDLKPENLFLLRDPSGFVRLKILDFGIAKSLNRRGRALTFVGRGIGSPRYMAPEQIEGRPEIDHRADLWTLGVVAYELLAGQCPFQGSSILEICTKVLQRRPIPLRELRADTWPLLHRFVERCLRKRPEDRFADVFEARTALEDLEETLDERITHIPGISRRRWPKIALASAACAGIGLACAGPQRTYDLGNRKIHAYVAHAETHIPADAVDRTSNANAPSAPVVLHSHADRDIPRE